MHARACTCAERAVPRAVLAQACACTERAVLTRSALCCQIAVLVRGARGAGGCLCATLGIVDSCWVRDPCKSQFRHGRLPGGVGWLCRVERARLGAAVRCAALGIFDTCWVRNPCKCQIRHGRCRKRHARAPTEVPTASGGHARALTAVARGAAKAGWLRRGPGAEVLAGSQPSPCCRVATWRPVTREGVVAAWPEPAWSRTEDLATW